MATTTRGPATERDGNRTEEASASAAKITRQELIQLLNEDLSREYQAIIAYVNYSQVLKGAAYMKIAKELEIHATEELAHALKISKQIDYLGGMPTVEPKPVETSKVAQDMLRFDLYNEIETIANYRALYADASVEILTLVSRDLGQPHVTDDKRVLTAVPASGGPR